MMIPSICPCVYVCVIMHVCGDVLPICCSCMLLLFLLVWVHMPLNGACSFAPHIHITLTKRAKCIGSTFAACADGICIGWFTLVKTMQFQNNCEFQSGTNKYSAYFVSIWIRLNKEDKPLNCACWATWQILVAC